MRLNIFTALSLMASAVASAALDPRAAPQDFRSISFNIRYAAPASTYERPWSTRGPLVISQLKNATTTATATSTGSIPIIGLQEVLHQQLVDVKNGLGSSWTHLGTGRDDGKQAGEYIPLLYQPSFLSLVSSTQKWLSPTPDVPSFWPGAGSRRYVIVAVFEVVATGRRFVAANTHLDNASQTARIEGIKVALKTIRDVRAQFGTELPVLLTGDFNSIPGSGDAYGATVSDGLLADLHSLAAPAQRFGPEGTFSGFEPGKEPNNRIDFIWLGPNATSTCAVRRYEVLENVVGGVYISDHRAVVGDITLR